LKQRRVRFTFIAQQHVAREIIRALCGARREGGPQFNG
jgi:hypothetical protein